MTIYDPLPYMNTTCMLAERTFGENVLYLFSQIHVTMFVMSECNLF